MQIAAIGVSAHLGWAAAAVISVARGVPSILRTERIETAPPDDREAREPYHVAGGFEGLARVPRPADPRAALRRGLRRQERTCARALAALAEQLAEEDFGLRCAGLLVSRGRPAASFEQAIGSHTQIHIEEGRAVRTSLAKALNAAGAAVHEIDQKSVLAIASELLGRGERELMAALAATRPQNDGPWRKEEKLAAAAAWIAWHRRRRG